jgi:hypothetical protein
MPLPTYDIRTISTVPPGAARASAVPEGFDGRLQHLGLADLVQLECLTSNRTSVVVRSAGRQGQLFFDSGQLVHAVVGTRVGDPAALEILSWTSGTFACTEATWPSQPSVVQPWQQLLLSAAHRADEERRDSVSPVSPLQAATRLVEMASFREAHAPGANSDPEWEIEVEGAEPAEREGRPLPRSGRRPALAGAPPKPPRVLRMDGSGRVTRRVGDCSALEQARSTIMPLLDELGEWLGLERIGEAVIDKSGTRWALFTEDGGGAVWVEAPPGACIDSLRRAADAGDTK